MDLRWLLAIFVVGPLMAVMAINVSIMVSSRVNDPRVAEQISSVMIVPVLALLFGQTAGLIILNQGLVYLSILIMLGIDAALIFAGAQLFQRETILTRWK
jgi:ABC-2 type transport system permease protein